MTAQDKGKRNTEQPQQTMMAYANRKNSNLSRKRIGQASQLQENRANCALPQQQMMLVNQNLPGNCDSFAEPQIPSRKQAKLNTTDQHHNESSSQICARNVRKTLFNDEQQQPYLVNNEESGRGSPLISLANSEQEEGEDASMEDQGMTDPQDITESEMDDDDYGD